jgi:hypothetical protein
MLTMKAHIPLKYHSYISKEPTKVTKVNDVGIVAYHGEDNVEQITYEYGTSKTVAILPALININEKGKLKQVSVIIRED